MIIEYTELSRESLTHGGYRIVGRYYDTEPGGTFDINYRFYVDSEYPSEAMVTDRVNFLIGKAYFHANPLNTFDLGNGDVQQVVNSSVVYVRANPGTGIPAVITAIDTAHPSMLWKPYKFLETEHQYLETEMARNYTWDEFKQFMIDEKFEELD